MQEHFKLLSEFQTWKQREEEVAAVLAWPLISFLTALLSSRFSNSLSCANCPIK